MTKELPKPNGRWKIDYCNTKINNKIDLSNEDHCGPCGQYAKKIFLQNNIYDKITEKEREREKEKEKEKEKEEIL